MDLDAYTKLREEWTKAYHQRLAQRILGEVEVVGIYPVKASEPVHLVELVMRGVGAGFDFGSIVQPVPDTPSGMWQAPWAEVLLDKDGHKVLAKGMGFSEHPELLMGDFRAAFFMHFLDLDRPLSSPFGEIRLPKPVPRPRRLNGVRYEQPD